MRFFSFNSFLLLLLIVCAIPLLTSCEKENIPVEAILPDEVPFGTTIVYLNGERMDRYMSQKIFLSGSNTFGFSFYDSIRPGYTNALGFDWMPLEAGKYPIGKPGVLYEVATASFSQIIDEDLDGYEYDLIEAENGYFHITHLDTTHREVRGHFKAKFRRTGKNGYNDGNLPKILLYQGIFNDSYEVF